MLLTPHTLAGVVIATKVTNPYLALPLAFLSHFALDIVPHWDFLTGVEKVTPVILKRIAGEFLVALAVGLFFAFRALPDKNLFLRICAGAFLANLPDGLEMPKSIFGKSNPISNAINGFQHFFHFRAKFPWGLFPQVAIVVFFLLLLLG